MNPIKYLIVAFSVLLCSAETLLAGSKGDKKGCYNYSTSINTAEQSLGYASQLYDEIPAGRQGSIENIDLLVEYENIEKESYRSGSDPVFLLVWSYKMLLSNEIGVSLALVENTTKSLLKSDLCEEGVIFALMAAVRYEISKRLYGGEVPGYWSYVSEFEKEAVDFSIDDFELAVCWIRHMNSDLKSNFHGSAYFGCR